MSTVKAYLVEYRVTVVAYGRTAAEAVANGTVLFANGDSMTEPFVSEVDGDADLYAATVARYEASRPIGRARRSPDHDASLCDDPDCGRHADDHDDGECPGASR